MAAASAPVRSATAASDPAAPCTCCLAPETRRRRPSLELPSRQGATSRHLCGPLRPRGPWRNFVPGELRWANFTRGCGETRGMAPAISLYLELRPGNARSPDQALSPRPAEGYTPASVARSGEAGPQLPTPLRSAGRTEGRSHRSRSPAAPTAGAAPPPRPPVPACPPPACRARRHLLITWPRPPPAPGGNLKLL